MNQKGYTLAGALALLAVMAVLLAMALPLWSKVKQRDNEEELIFRGNEYIKAIARYQAKFNTYPPDLETLYKLKYVRHEYKDPMTKSGKWKVLHPESLTQTGAAGMINVSGQLDPKKKKDKDQSGNPTGGSIGGKHDNDDDDDDDDRNQTQTQPGQDCNDCPKDEEPEVESVGPVVGIASRSLKNSMKIYNGQTKYNQWVFVYALPQKPGPQPPPGGVPKPGAKPGTPPTTKPGGVVSKPQPPPDQGDDDTGDDDDDDDDNR